MSVQAMSWVLENSESRLGPRHVLISIANHAKADGTGAWPSIQTIAREARLSEREVQYSLKILESLGELAIGSGAGPKGCNLYSLPKMLMDTVRKVCTPQNRARGVQNPAKNVVDFAPEPKSFNRPLKQPSNTAPQAGAPHAPEQLRRIEAKNRRLEQEKQIRAELYAGAGPSVTR